MTGTTLATGGLIALDRDNRRLLVLIARPAERGIRITVSATALAQAIRNPAKQVPLTRMIRQVSTDLIVLDGPDATFVGILLARTETAGIVHAHVVVCVRRASQAVVTSDPNDLPRLGPELDFVAV